MHTLHCMRNITLCTSCDEPISKRDFDDHKQHCPANQNDNLVSNKDLLNGCAETSKEPPKETSTFPNPNSCTQKFIEKEKVKISKLFTL